MSDRKYISVDGMGGDHAPESVVGGLELFAKRRPDIRFLLHGDEQRLNALLSVNPAARALTDVRHASEIVSMDAKPAQAVRLRDTSMRNAIESVRKGEAMAAVSAGNTGALMAMSKLILRMAPGVRRPALVGSWPTIDGKCAMLDLGADISANARQLVEFAIMGAAFARAVHHKPHPTVGLLNVGSEDLKGHDELREAAKLLREAKLDFTFQGFVEGNDICAGAVDVVVTDGFTGNIALKAAEGTARMIADLLKKELTGGVLSMVGAVFATGALNRLRAQLDPRNVNGGVFLGLNGVCVKSHGGTDASGFAQAISVAADMGESHFMQEVAGNIARAPGLAEAPIDRQADEEPAQ